MTGEVPRVAGGLQVSDAVALCPQTAWITNDTVRSNILLGRVEEPERLAEAIRVAQLGPDLEQLPRGIETLIGERGVSLSGGQKARVSLARAVYSGVETVLLDDPLSAVDAHVGEAIFAQAITGALAGKTRVLVTNALQYLPRCDRILVLETGSVSAMGTWDEVKDTEAYRRASAEIVELERKRRESIAEEEEEAGAGLTGVEVELADTPSAAGGSASAGDDDDDVDAAAGSSAAAASGAVTADSTQATSSASSSSSSSSAAAMTASKDASATSAPPSSGAGGSAVVPGAMGDKAAGTRTTEGRETGSVALAAYLYYFRAAGWVTVVAVIAAQVLGRVAELGSAFWVSYWAERVVTGAAAAAGETATFYLNIYAAIGCAGVLMITVRACCSAECRVRASFLLHERLLRHVIRAPTAWFDDTPVGRVLNRFSGDIEKIDEQLPPTLTQLLGTMVSVIGAVVAIAVSSNGVLVIALVPLLIFYYSVQRWFRRSSTELQRIESLTRSPIYVSFDATLDGLASIRAYKQQTAFSRRNREALDANTVPFLLMSFASFWLSLRLDAIGAVLAFGVAAVAAAGQGFVPAGWVGVGLSTALEMTTFLKHGVRMLAQAESQMNAVERVKEYSEDTPVEDELVHSPKTLRDDPSLINPPPAWPSEGRVTFENVRMRYGLPGRQGPEVLKGLSFDIPPRSTVGIVGRTGSGKSSTALVLFRLVEACGGRVLIDGVDASKVALGRVRSGLAIVPQDPVLFSPSVRANLDPFGRHSDAALRMALARVELDGKLGLDDEVRQGGSNLSQGTRQLICIARAILRRPRVLVMDEATASVDERTDEVVQRAMREAFRDATVLVIAHRLRTIADADLVLVLDSGEVAEIDAPHELLENTTKYPASQFRQLVDRTGPQAADIRRMAKEAHDARAL